MASAKHFVILSPGFAESERDDVCMPYLQDLLQVFQAVQPDVKFSVIAFQYPYAKGQYEWNGVKVNALGGKNRRWMKLLTWYRATQAVKELHQKAPLDGILSLWLGETAYIGQRIAKNLKLKHVAVAMGQDVLSINPYMNRLSAENLDIISVSDRAATLLQQNSKLQAKAVIPFAEPTPESTSITPWEGREIDILGVGGLSTLKRFDDFVKTLYLIRSQNPNVRAVLIGEGSERGRIERMIKDLGLGRNLEMTGQLSRKKTLEYMLKAKVLLHTSSYESMGYVFVEALNRGMYIVSTPVGLAQTSPDWKVQEMVEDMADACRVFLNGEGPDMVERKAQQAFSAKALVEGYSKLLGI